MLYPSTTTGRRDIQRNGKWRSNVNVNCRIVDVSLNISASSGCRRMKQPPFDAARRGGSNELRYILIRSLDAEIIEEMHFFKFFKSNFSISVSVIYKTDTENRNTETDR